MPESGRIAISCLSSESSLASTRAWRSEKGRCVSRAKAQERLLAFVNRGLRDTHCNLGGFFYVPENEHHDSSFIARLLSSPIRGGGGFWRNQSDGFLYGESICEQPGSGSVSGDWAEPVRRTICDPVSAGRDPVPAGRDRVPAGTDRRRSPPMARPSQLESLRGAGGGISGDASRFRRNAGGLQQPDHMPDPMRGPGDGSGRPTTISGGAESAPGQAADHGPT